MDVKKYLVEQIKKCRFRMNLAKLIDFGILAAAAGGIGGILCELASLIWQFYYVHLAAGLCFAAGLLAGLGYAVYRRADMKQAAMRLDSFGLKERMITAYEQIQMEELLSMESSSSIEEKISVQNVFIQKQREDARRHYEQIREQIKIPLCPDRKHIFALLLSVAVVVGMGLIPSSVREQAQIRHQVQAQAKEEQEMLEELLEALEGVDMESLTEEQKAQMQDLQEAMKLSQEELSKADSWESLASALEKLDYKYEQAGQSLDRLASQLENPEAAGIAAANAIAQAAMASQNGSQMAAGGMTASANQNSGEGSNGGNSGDGSNSGSGDNSGDGSNSGSGDNSGNGSNSGSGDNSGNGSNSGSGDNSGSGSNSGNGGGSGSGDGDGSNGGSGGNGSGGNGGNGRGTGSSTAVHDYVSVPNAVGNDSALTGNKNGDQDSDYYRQQNGLAWEGKHVDYNTVIGEYTNNAYEGIANNRYPSGMESVIRDYFENLNK